MKLSLHSLKDRRIKTNNFGNDGRAYKEDTRKIARMQTKGEK